MQELVASGNTLSELMIAALAPKLPQATIGKHECYQLHNVVLIIKTL
jgi:hypothetical protein